MAQRYYLPAFLIISACALRVSRHFGVIDLPPNFAPIGGLALFAGAVFERRVFAVMFPLTAMAVSDLFIGFYDAPIMAAVYGSFIISVLLGRYIQARPSFIRIVGSSLVSSTVFFLITNFAVWLFSGMYLPDISGLEQALLMGTPFFKWTLAGDLFYTGVLFGLWYFVLFVAKFCKRANIIIEI